MTTANESIIHVVGLLFVTMMYSAYKVKKHHERNEVLPAIFAFIAFAITLIVEVLLICNYIGIIG